MLQPIVRVGIEIADVDDITCLHDSEYEWCYKDQFSKNEALTGTDRYMMVMAENMPIEIRADEKHAKITVKHQDPLQ